MSRRRKRRAKKLTKGLRGVLQPFVGAPANKPTLDALAAVMTGYMQGMLSRTSFVRSIFPEVFQPKPPFHAMADDGVVHLVGEMEPDVNANVFLARVCDRMIAQAAWAPVPLETVSCLSCLSHEHDTKAARGA
jgi:hypothetical protein